MDKDRKSPPPFENDPDFLNQIEEKLEPHRRFPDVHLKLLDVPLSEQEFATTQSARSKRRSISTKKYESEFSCHICGLQLSKKSNLLRHLTRHTEASKPFRCTMCNQSYKELCQLKSHLVTAHNENPRSPAPEPTGDFELNFSCHLCCRRFTSQAFVFRHLKTHTEVEKPFVCPVCDEAFAESNPLNSHLVTQHSDQYKLLTNKSCWSYRNRNKRSKSGKPKVAAIQVIHLTLQCTKCPKRFAYQSYLNNHMITNHQTERTHVCEICGTKYKHAFNLRQHLADQKCQSVIDRMAERPYKCDHCEVAFKIPANLRKHMQTFHGVRRVRRKTDKQTLTCLFCGYVASAATVLVQHNRIHTGERPFVCKGCGSTFSHKSNFYAHLRSCPKAKEMGLQQAERRHPKGFRKRAGVVGPPYERFKCSNCVLTFTCPRSRDYHQGTHGDKFPCSFCSCAFKHAAGLAFHKSRVHPSEFETFKCEECGKILTTTKGLECHRRNLHRLLMPSSNLDNEPEPMSVPMGKTVEDPVNIVIQSNKRPKVEIAKQVDPLSTLTTVMWMEGHPSSSLENNLSVFDDFSDDSFSSWIDNIDDDTVASGSQEPGDISFPPVAPTTVLKMEY